MNERIRQFLLAENKSSAQFADEIGVQPSGISHILSGRNKPSLDFIIKMLEKYKSLSVEWLLFGRGQMYSEGGTLNLFDTTLGKENKSVEEVLPDENSGKESIALNSFSDEKGHNMKGGPLHSTKTRVKKIVWFYNDNTFEEYYPGSED